MPTVADLASALHDRAQPAPPVSVFLTGVHPREQPSGRPRRRVVAVLVVAAVLTAIAVPTWITSNRSHVEASHQIAYTFTAATLSGTVIAPADRLPAGPVTGPLLGGGAFRLSDHQGTVVLLQYVASWCQPCARQATAANVVSQTGDAVSVVGIDIADQRGSAQSWVDYERLNYPIVFDPQAHTASVLGHVPVAALPMSVFVDRQGRVAAVYSGRLSATSIAATAAILNRE